MNAKTIIRLVLLSVVTIAVGAWAIKEFGPATAVVTTRPDGVTVINFHGNKRCRTCIAIGKLAKQTLAEEFAAEQQSQKVHWEIINYDEPSNAHYVKDYELVSSTVLVTLWKDGEEVTWQRLDEVWDHVDDEPAFRAYVAQGVRELLNRS